MSGRSSAGFGFLGGGLLAAFVLAPMAASRAEPKLLTQAQIAETVPGATFHLDSPIGIPLPVSFAPDGTMSGRAGSALGFFLGADTDSGRWWLADGRLCKKWTRWFKGKANCVTLKREGSKLYWERPDGENGTATIVVPAPPPAQLAKASPVPKRIVPPQAVVVEALREPAPAASKPMAVGAAPTAAVAPAPLPAKRPVQIASASSIALPVPKPAVAPPRKAASAALPASAQPAPSTTAPKYMVANVAMDDVLNVRAGPSHLTPIKATLPPDASGLRIVGTCESGWCIVRYRAVTGWVNSYYLTLVAEQSRGRS